MLKYFKHIGLNRYTIKINFSCFFYFLSGTTRKFKVTCVAYVLFLSDSGVLQG